MKKIDIKSIDVPIYKGRASGVMMTLFLSAFLSGKDIPIAFGTHKGGIICATGALVIMITMFLMTLGACRT